MGKKRSDQSKDPPWYHEGLQFECTQCGGCCSGEPGYVWVDPGEIEQLARHLDLSIDEFESRYVRKVGAHKSLTELPNGDCVFLHPETRGCTVYEARPIQCRTWPFWDSNLKNRRAWRETCEICPGSGKGRLYSFDEIEIRRREKEV